MKFLLASYAHARASTCTMNELAMASLAQENFLSTCEIGRGKCMHVDVIYRGSRDRNQFHQAVALADRSRVLRFVEWGPFHPRPCFVDRPPVVLPSCNFG